MNPPETTPPPKLDIRSIEKSKPHAIDSQPSPNFEAERRYLENEKSRIELGGLRQDIRARKIYAALFFALACAWVVVISVLLFFQGFGAGSLDFRLSYSVLLAAIGSTTADIIGVVYVVANYLFPAGRKRGSPE